MYEYLFCDDCRKIVENPIVRNYSDIGQELLCPSCKIGVGMIKDTELLEIFEGETDVPDIVKQLREEYADE